MDFDQKVWNAIKRIPKGKVSTYGEIAKEINSPYSARAVGNACNKNLFSPEVACHRVVKSDGSIGGFAHGTKKKIAMLEKEGIEIKKDKVADFKEKLFGFS